MATHTTKQAEPRPGSRVRTRDGVLGTVERIERESYNPADQTGQSGYLIIQAEDQAQRYRVPLALVRRTTRRNGHVTVHLDLATSDLSAYLGQEAATHRSEEPSESQPEPRRSEEWSPSHPGETLTIPVATEELTVRTEPITLGTVHLHKGVESFEYRVRVPVHAEQVTVERIPADQFDARAPRDPNELIVPILEERPVLRVETVVREYLRVRKERVTEERDVATTLRRERVDIAEERADPSREGPPLQRPEPPDAMDRQPAG